MMRLERHINKLATIKHKRIQSSRQLQKDHK